MDCGFVAVSESKESFELPLDKALRKWALDNSKDSFVNEIGRYWDMLHDAERFSSDVLRIK